MRFPAHVCQCRESREVCPRVYHQVSRLVGLRACRLDDLILDLGGGSLAHLFYRHGEGVCRVNPG